LDEIKIKIAGNKRESQRISDDLGTFGSSIDVSWLETQRNDAQIQFEKYSVAVSANEADRAENERQLNAAKTKLVGESDISSRDKALRNTTDLLLRSVNKSFGGFREEMRKQIQDKATESLKILTSEPHIYGSVQISSDYHIQILTPQGVALKTSNAGHQQILTTAFVSAMAAVSTESTPFMMDTALSHLDTDNSRQMLEWTKQIGQQVVLLVQPKELSREDAHRILGSSIGREYEIDRNNDQAEESHIMEVVK
jgi:DNA sulfur modification protein DndD